MARAKIMRYDSLLKILDEDDKVEGLIYVDVHMQAIIDKLNVVQTSPHAFLDMLASKQFKIVPKKEVRQKHAMLQEALLARDAIDPHVLCRTKRVDPFIFFQPIGKDDAKCH